MSVLTSDLKVAVKDIGAELHKLDVAYTTRKSQLTGLLEQHIVAHQQAAAAHAAEIAAAQAVLQKAEAKSGTDAATQAAVFALTGASKFETFLSKYVYRWPTLFGSMGVGIAAALKFGLIKL